MARIRSIKPSFFTSLTVAEMTPEERLTYIGLWTHSDDEGRSEYDPRLIKAALWPLADKVTPAVVSRHVERLVALGRVVRYVVGERAYLQVVNWREHQSISKPRKSTLPPPPNPDAAPECSGTPPGNDPEGSGEEGKGKEGSKEGKGKGVRKYPHFPDDLRVAFRERWRAKVGAVDMDRMVRDLAPIFDRPELEWGFTREEALAAVGFGYEWAVAADRRGRRPFEVPNFSPKRFADNFARYLAYVREGMATPDGSPTAYARFLDVPEVA